MCTGVLDYKSKCIEGNFVYVYVSNYLLCLHDVFLFGEFLFELLISFRHGLKKD